MRDRLLALPWLVPNEMRRDSWWGNVLSSITCLRAEIRLMDIQWVIFPDKLTVKGCRVCRELMLSQIRRERGVSRWMVQLYSFAASDHFIMVKEGIVYRAWHFYL